MNKISVEQQEMSIKSLESTFNKLSNAFNNFQTKHKLVSEANYK